jgi:2-phospho-L-lactate/phosphoenolpyruvate guanylyltransferase
MQVVAVPVKEPNRSKSRLGGVLAEHERAALTIAMLEDVLAATVQQTEWETWVISPEDGVLALAGRVGARPVAESGRSLRAAIRQVEGALPLNASLAVVLGDLPWLTPGDLRTALETPGPAVAAPASSDGGTNLLLRRPRSIIPARFGTASFARHAAEAERAGIELTAVRTPGLAHDLDRPRDLLRLIESGHTGSTGAVCLRLGLAGRLLDRTGTKRG